jgi:hypothetical protein
MSWRADQPMARPLPCLDGRGRSPGRELREVEAASRISPAITLSFGQIRRDALVETSRECLARRNGVDVTQL